MAEPPAETSPQLPTPPPALAPDVIEPAEHESQWPKVIGVISIIYALGGLLCNVGFGAMTVFAEPLMKMQGAEINIPLPFKIITIAIVLIVFVLGIMLLIGGIKLLRRRRTGVTIIQRWALLRMIMLLIGVLTLFFTSPTQVDMARARAAGQAQMRGGGESFTPPSDEALHRSVVIQTAVFTGLAAIYPLTVGLYLSRRKIKRQIEHWPNR